jgi:hypothetical protein
MQTANTCKQHSFLSDVFEQLALSQHAGPQVINIDDEDDIAASVLDPPTRKVGAPGQPSPPSSAATASEPPSSSVTVPVVIVSDSEDDDDGEGQKKQQQRANAAPKT